MGIGSFFSGGSQKAETKPWDGQSDYLRQIFWNTKQNYLDRSSKPGYEGQFYADVDPALMDFSRGALSGAQGSYGVAGQVLNSGRPLLGQGALYGGNANALYDRMSTNPSASIAKGAGQFINNGVLNGQIDAASRDVTRNLSEVQLPSVARDAADTGNLGSSARGAAEAILMRGAQDRIADIGATMRGDAYARGLGLSAEAEAMSRNGALAANAQVGETYRTGMNGVLSGIDARGAAFGQGVQAGGVLQSGAQTGIDNGIARFEYDDQRNQQLLQDWYNVVGGNNWGGSTKSKGGGASPFQTLLGTGLAVGSLFMGNPMGAAAAGGGALATRTSQAAPAGGSYRPFGY